MRLVKNKNSELESAIDTAVAAVTEDVALSDLYEVAVENDLPIAVIDEERRLLGVIPRVTLLAALGNIDITNGDPNPMEPPPTIPMNIITETLLESAPEGSTETDEPAAVKGGAQ
jgi:glycine betaine/proline transport system ATP-binding protein